MCVCVCPYERLKKSFANDGLEKNITTKIRLCNQRC